MNILLATSEATPSGGGVASYNEELRNLFSSSHKLYLITAANERDIDGYEQTISTYDNDWKTLEYSEFIVRKIDEWDIDVVINSDSQLMAIIAPFVKIPIVSVSHFVNGTCALNAGYNSEYIGRIISLSYYGKEYLEREFDIKEEGKVKVVYNFVAEKKMPTPSSKATDSPLTIIYPGGTSIKKSVDVVMRTIYRLLKTDVDFRFIWLGQTTLPLAGVSPHKQTTQFFPKDNRLIIKGKVTRNEAVSLIESANVFLLPSRGEGCPMTLLEAMRAGCIPVVSDAKHGSREILEQGQFGRIVKQDDSKELKNVLIDIVTNHEKYTNDYQATYEYSNKKLTPSIWAEKMIKAIDEAQNIKKMVLPLTMEAFNKSSKGFFDRFKKIKKKEHWASFKCRLYLEYMYYFVR